MGRAYSPDKNCVYIVARYRPPGNILGSESENVARGSMDGEYCGREFMALNKPNQAKGSSQVDPGQSPQTTVKKVSGNTSEGSEPSSNTNSNKATSPETDNQIDWKVQQAKSNKSFKSGTVSNQANSGTVGNQNNQENTNQSTSEVNPLETNDYGRKNQQIDENSV